MVLATKMANKHTDNDETRENIRKTSTTTSTISDDLYVVTENGEQCFMWRRNQLTYIAQDRKEIPSILAQKFGHLATKLDLSYNSLTSYKHISLFTNLNELILDNNCLSDDQLDFKLNLRLKTLSLNKNKLTNLYKLVNSIKIHFPNLEYLSLIGNPICLNGSQAVGSPTTDSNLQTDGETTSNININHHNELTTRKIHLTGSIEELIIGQPAQQSQQSPECLSASQQKYRHFIIYHLPNLRFLDSSPISGRERDEALRRCFWMKSASVEQAQSNQLFVNYQQLSANNNQQVLATPTISLDPDRQDNELASFRCRPLDNNEPQHFRLTIISSNDNDNLDQGQQQVQTTSTTTSDQPKGVFSRLVYKYTGRNSEGNRFIRNQDL